LYVPLGGNRKGRVRTYVNLFVVMLLGGLWHGAAWNFVIWGALHGALLALERLRGGSALYKWWPAPLRIAATFILVLVTWVFFRAADLQEAMRYLGDMAGVSGRHDASRLLRGLVYEPYHFATFLLAGAVVWTAPQTWDWTRTLTAPKAAAVLTLLIVAAVALATQEYNPFIYFIF
jgi:alginate O-acetyltransferase complex protein AlgI